MLHGREDEISDVEARLDAARRGASSSLLVLGEPGIGKTAVLDWAAERAVAAGFRVLRATGYASERDLPYAGLHALLGPVLELREAIPEVQARALGTALALEAPASYDPFAVPAAVFSLLGTAAEEGPILVAIDDLQWLDDGSLRALTFTARRLESEGIVLLCAARAGEIGALDLSGIEELRLGVLDDRAARALLADLDVGLAAEVAERLLETCAGHPLALRELPASLTPAQRSGTEPISASVCAGSMLEHSVMARYAALCDEGRQALAVVAAMESGWLNDALAAMAQMGLGEADLDAPSARGLVRISGGTVAFTHPLLRAFVYDATRASQRRAAHAALASVTKDVTQRAWHLSAAALGTDEEAASALVAAAGVARGRGAAAAAAAAARRAAELTADEQLRLARTVQAVEDLAGAGLFDQALALVAEAERLAVRLPEVPELRVLRARIEVRGNRVMEGRAGLEAEAERLAQTGERVAAASLMLEAAVGGVMLGDTPGIVAATDRARELAAGHDDQLTQLAAMLRALALVPVGRVREVAADLEAAVPFLLAEGDPLPDASEVFTWAGQVAMWIERYDVAEAVIDRQLAAARSASAAGRLAFPLMVKAQLGFRRGRWTQARADAGEGVRLARETGQIAQLVMTLSALARLEAARGELDAAVAHGREAVAALGPVAGGPMTVYAHEALGFAALTAERPEEALDHLLRARKTMLALGGSEPGVYLYPGDLIEALVRAERPHEAAEEIARLAEWSAATGRIWGHAVAARGEGMLAPDDAFRAPFARALEWHARLEQPFEEARTRLALGERLRRAGLRVEARSELEAAVAVFDRLGATAWADRGRGELRASGRTLRPRDEMGEELTPAELQVALRVADGLTNREVAAALFLSPKTVEHHLSAVYRKLGIKSRTQLARYMASEGVGV